MFADEEAHALNLPDDAKAAAQRDIDFPEASVPFLTYADYTCYADDRTTDLLHTMTVTFAVREDGVARIGFRTNNVNTSGIANEDVSGDIDENGENVRGQGWFKVDNFTLYYASEELPSSIECVDSQDSAILSTTYYTIDGVRSSNLQKGVNIVKSIMSNGNVKISKILVK